MIGNVLIHREFTNPYPAKLVIEQDRVFTENWNKPHGRGNIDPDIFSPYPKNPMIARFFKEIGRVDELGSGVRNTFKYCSLLNGEMKRSEIQRKLGLKHDDYFRLHYIEPAMKARLIEMTYPDSPNHPNQKYRLTEKGEQLKKKISGI